MKNKRLLIIIFTLATISIVARIISSGEFDITGSIIYLVIVAFVLWGYRQELKV